jgi:hypothetical protein
MALAIGVGRAPIGGQMGIWSRYSFLTWPLLGLAYLAWVKWGMPWGKRWLPMLFCVVSALAFAGNMITGMAIGMQVKATLSLVEAEAAAGVPPEVIVEKFAKTSQANQEERAIRAIPMLREAKIGGFAGK